MVGRTRGLAHRRSNGADLGRGRSLIAAYISEGRFAPTYGLATICPEPARGDGKVLQVRLGAEDMRMRRAKALSW
jgi:hypothetical protein